jgi:deazaflavin-dependent oxidoreductase (nitroreductase family)
MARPYRLGFWRRLVNRIVSALLRLDLNPLHTYLLMVPGRKSRKPYSTPVTLVEENGERWLVSPYGEVGWVKNARATGQVTLKRGRRSEPVGIIELSPDAAAPVLKKYLSCPSIGVFLSKESLRMRTFDVFFIPSRAGRPKNEVVPVHRHHSGQSQRRPYSGKWWQQ